MRQKRNPVIYVRADSLKIHPIAQRDLVLSKLRQLKDELNLEAIGTLHGVAYEIDGDPGPWILDGQHRQVTLVNLGFGEWRVNVEIHTSVTNDAEAQNLFLQLNDRAVVSSWAKFKNKLGAGHTEAVAFNQISLSHGLMPSWGPADGHIVCTATGMKIIKARGVENLDQTLLIATSAWGRQAVAVEGKLLDGLSLLIDQYNGEIDQGALIKKLSKYPGGAAGVIGDAKGLHRIRRGTLPTCVKETLIEAYNTGRRGGKLS